MHVYAMHVYAIGWCMNEVCTGKFGHGKINPNSLVVDVRMDDPSSAGDI